MCQKSEHRRKNENVKTTRDVLALVRWHYFCPNVYAASLLLEDPCEGRIFDDKKIKICGIEIKYLPERGTHIALLPS